MAEAVYLLCAMTSAGCALALFRTFRRRHTSLLFWSSIAFTGLAVSNVILFLDLVELPLLDLSLARALVGATAMLVLVIALVFVDVD